MTVLERDAGAAAGSVRAWDAWERRGVEPVPPPALPPPRLPRRRRGRAARGHHRPRRRRRPPAEPARARSPRPSTPMASTSSSPPAVRSWKPPSRRRSPAPPRASRSAAASPSPASRPTRARTLRTSSDVRTEYGEVIGGDLVVDAVGRRSPMARWLAEAGAGALHGRGGGLRVRLLRPPRADPRRSARRAGRPLVLRVGRAARAPGRGRRRRRRDHRRRRGRRAARVLRHEAPWRAAHGAPARRRPGARLPSSSATTSSSWPASRTGSVATSSTARRWPPASCRSRDAWAATNPTLGRGISLGARHAVACSGTSCVRSGPTTTSARRSLRRGDRGAADAVVPATVWHDRHRSPTSVTSIEGTEREPDGAVGDGSSASAARRSGT